MGRFAWSRRMARAHPTVARVRAASRTVLDELATRLGVPRPPDESDEPTDPAPSLNRLDALVEGFAAGQPVRWTLAGQPRPLPGAVDVAAYRIIEESLTNARQHAPGAPVAVRLRYDAEGITIEVRDEGAGSGPAEPTPDGDAPGAGRGLLRVRKRAERVGGSFSAGPRPGGGFAVRAVLPAPEEVAE